MKTATEWACKLQNICNPIQSNLGHGRERRRTVEISYCVASWSLAMRALIASELAVTVHSLSIIVQPLCSRLSIHWQAQQAGAGRPYPHLFFLDLTHDHLSKITEEIAALCIKLPRPPVNDAPAASHKGEPLGEPMTGEDICPCPVTTSPSRNGLAAPHATSTHSNCNIMKPEVWMTSCRIAQCHAALHHARQKFQVHWAFPTLQSPQTMFFMAQVSGVLWCLNDGSCHQRCASALVARALPLVE